jgi:hypothetical protein
LLDFEQFIKGENAKIKVKGTNNANSSDDEMGAGSDSGEDSDESTKNIFVEQTRLFANKLNRKTPKKLHASKKPKEDDEVFKSMDNAAAQQSLTSTKNQHTSQHKYRK